MHASPARTVVDSDAVVAKVMHPRDDREWSALYSHMLRVNLPLFAKDVLGLEIGPHLRQWGDLVRTESRLCVNAARDHSKSTFFSYAYPIWRAWSEPGCEVYIFSATLDQAMEFLDIIIWGRDNLAGMVDIPALSHLVPDREAMKNDPRVRLNRQDVRLTNGSRFRALGYGKKVRGRHPKYIVLDDVLNDEDMFSETVRRKNIEYFKSAIVNMAKPDHIDEHGVSTGGQVLVIGTPYHAADLYGWLKKNVVYRFKRYPGIIKDKATGEERALFPWRWTLEKLKRKKLEIGPVAFTREILVQPISDDLSVFPSHLFPPLYDDTITIRPTKAEIRSRQLSIYMGVDIARSANVGADYFVIFVIGVDPHGYHYIVDIRRNKGMQFSKQLDLITMMGAQYDPALIFIESNAMQQIYTDEMRRKTDLPVKEFTTLATNKYPLDKGVPGLRILLENQKVIIPRGDELSVRVTDIWIEECTQFGFVDGKLQGAGEHDDTVMAWWFASEARKAGGFSFAMGDEDDLIDDDEEGDEDWEKVMLGDPDEGDAGAFI